MADIKAKVDKQREYFSQGKTKSLQFRLEMLRRLRSVINANQAEISNALQQDLKKSPFEAYITEIGFVLSELNYIIKKLPRWVKKQRVSTPLTNILAKSYIYPEPYGVSLIMAPWNYPFQLTIAPLIGSMAAGNCTVLKPSDYAANTAKVLERIISEHFDEGYITVISGGREENTQLLEQRFDYIFFTGSVAVGKIVMEKAAKFLTPVTLELGGKSPCIVDETANIDLAARRIIWGKLVNCGQTCVAPDYLYVHSKIKTELVDRIKAYLISFYGEDVFNNQEYPKIINEKHFNRLVNLLTDGNIIYGGKTNKASLQISPTVIDNINWENGVMQEEIFGPILPILEFSDLNEVITAIRMRPKPLALYLFSNSKANQQQILNSLSFGGGCINDTLVHLATPYMGFGGVGESGMGRYHGRESFNTFSHMKSILKKSNLVDIKLRYPPYKDKLKMVKKFMK